MSAEIPAIIFQRGPKASYLAVVESLPFQARFEHILVTPNSRGVSTEERVTGAIYRDSAGRVRREYGMHLSAGEEIELVVILDLAARTVVAIDTAAKRATRFNEFGLPPGQSITLRGWGFSGAWSLEGARGERMIEGVECKKAHRIVPPLLSAAQTAEAGETWVSDELKYSILERLSDSQGKHSWRLYDIQRVEPPNSLCVVPAEYTEVVKSIFSSGLPEH